DGGRTWVQQPMPFSRCGGGTPANGGDYERATDPWLSAAPDGTLHQVALAYSSVQPASAIVVSRSTDGGATWSATRTLIRDTGDFFNDKCSITADPVSPHYVYAVWDRTIGMDRGPSQFTRSADDGLSWETARAIYDPGVNRQTIGNEIVVLPNGTLVDLLVELTLAADGSVQGGLLGVIRSTDHGATWSTRVQVAQLLTVGTTDPRTGAFVRDGSIVPQIAVAPDGTLYVVWQDSRFSNGARDGIALARSSDGGLTWSAPVQVNGVPAVPAFTPNIAVRPDGSIGVTYFDFRPASNTATTLPTAHWLARSANATAWNESELGTPFDMFLAPTSGGPSVYFIGDYHALATVGNVFVPLFVQTNGTAANRTDVFISPQVSATSLAATKANRAASAVRFSATLELRARVNANLTWALREGPPGKRD
ncbi:MAG TPA: sialidase family protein, partial [Rudaea sp.]|nr:sialidase family protein [Rudaea sp.]